MLDQVLRLPSFDGIDLSNPIALQQHFMSMYQALNTWARGFSERANDPRYIVLPNGKTLADGTNQGLERGMLVLYHGTWSAATRLAARRALRFCDGRNGTPQIHPSPNDATTLQRYMLASAYGAASGTLGGAATHAHGMTQASAHSQPGINDHQQDMLTLLGCHAGSDIAEHVLEHCHHWEQNTECETAGGCTVCTGAGFTAAPACHVHPVCGDTQSALGAGCACHSGCLAHSGTLQLNHTITNWDGTHTGASVSAASADVPHCTVIVLMKT